MLSTLVSPLKLGVAAKIPLTASVASTLGLRHFSSTASVQRPPDTTVANGSPTLRHFKYSENEHPLDKSQVDIRDPIFKRNPSNYMLFMPVYTREETEQVKVTHIKPKSFRDYVALGAISAIRFGFDLVTGYGYKKFTEADYLNRIVFLETVAGVPGMVGGMHRHMKSLRLMRRDRGWVHTLLEECENERMHLLTFLQLKQPSTFSRFMVLLGQGVFFNLYFVFYWVAPHYCHRFVGYLEEEAVRTYTHILKDIDEGELKSWKEMEAPPIGKAYWRLGDKATMKDLILAVRADEANHRDVNHVLSEVKETDANPFSPPPDEVSKA